MTVDHLYRFESQDKGSSGYWDKKVMALVLLQVKCLMLCEDKKVMSVDKYTLQMSNYPSYVTFVCYLQVTTEL